MAEILFFGKFHFWVPVEKISVNPILAIQLLFGKGV
jgi:hypothetical protein